MDLELPSAGTVPGVICIIMVIITMFCVPTCLFHSPYFVNEEIKMTSGVWEWGQKENKFGNRYRMEDKGCVWSFWRGEEGGAQIASCLVTS